MALDDLRKLHAAFAAAKAHKGRPTVILAKTKKGFGMGGATAEIAQTLPGHDFIGCEVHTPGVGALLKQIGECGLTNLRIVQHDAVPVFEQMLAPDSLAAVHVFFPDPWHKKKHNKRRLIQPDLRHQPVLIGLVMTAASTLPGTIGR